MDTTEKKEQTIINMKNLTRFQRKQIMMLFNRFLAENEEASRNSSRTCTQELEEPSKDNQDRKDNLK